MKKSFRFTGPVGCLSIGLGFLLAVAMPVSASVLVIDDFSDPTNRVTTSKGQQAWYDETSTVIGGIRDGSVGCETAEADGTTTARFSNGLFSVETNKKASPSIYLAYDGASGWGTDLDTAPFNSAMDPTLDFTGNGTNDRFSILFASADGMDPETSFFNDVLLTVKLKNDATLYDGGALQCPVGGNADAGGF